VSKLESWAVGEHTHDGTTHATYRKGTGPGVIVISEIPGITPRVIEFSDEVVAAGFTVVMPHLFGRPGADNGTLPVARTLGQICVSREMTMLALGQTQPVAGWLRSLARELHAELGGPGVGALGMCFTGGFALAMMAEPSVVASVLSQPSLPLPLGPGAARRRSGMGVSGEEVACARRRFEAEGLSMIGLRFKGDPSVPDERFESYQQAFGDRFERWDIEPSEAAPGPMKHPHSVLTVNLRETGVTKAAEQRVIAFFRERTGA